MFWIALIIFAVSIALFIFEWFDKTLVALTGAVLLMLTGVLTWEEAIMAIDFETIALLFGLMLSVGCVHHSGIFEWVNTKIAKKSRANPLAIFILFCGLTFLASTILNEVTVVLMIIPIAIALCTGLGINSKLMVIGVAMFSNVGGALTLIGDAPNTIIGVQADLNFNQFLLNHGPAIFVTFFLTFVFLIISNWKHLKPISRSLPKVFIGQLIIQRISYLYQRKNMNRVLVTIVTLMLLLTVIAFIIQPVLGVAIGVIGLASGAFSALAVSRYIPLAKIAKEVEWDSLLFFAALFIEVGALEKVGFLEIMSTWIAGFSDNFSVMLLIIVWGIGLPSTIIFNIPFVAVMVPVIFDLQTKFAGEPHVDLLWWALALAACLGGNGTIIGSSSGILAIDIARKNGVKIGFAEFAKIGMPVTLISLTVVSAYLLLRVQL